MYKWFKVSFLCLNIILKAYSDFYCIAVGCFLQYILDHEWLIEEMGIFIQIYGCRHNSLSVYSKSHSVDQLLLCYSNLKSKYSLYKLDKFGSMIRVQEG